MGVASVRICAGYPSVDAVRAAGPRGDPGRAWPRPQPDGCLRRVGAPGKGQVGMPRWLRIRRTDIVQSLGFVPTVIVAAFAALAIALVEVDKLVETARTAFVFRGDADAARTLLSVIAGSLITVAGLVFSMTLVVLQLASTTSLPVVSCSTTSDCPPLKKPDGRIGAPDSPKS